MHTIKLENVRDSILESSIHDSELPERLDFSDESDEDGDLFEICGDLVWIPKTGHSAQPRCIN